MDFLDLRGVERLRDAHLSRHADTPVFLICGIALWANYKTNLPGPFYLMSKAMPSMAFSYPVLFPMNDLPRSGACGDLLDAGHHGQFSVFLVPSVSHSS